MIDFELWLINVISDVAELSDREFQKHVWFEGKDTDIYFSSFEEAYCRLFDGSFDSFLKEEKIASDVRLVEMLSQFSKDINSFQYQSDYFDERAYQSKAWLDINHQASAILHRLLRVLWKIRSSAVT